MRTIRATCPLCSDQVDLQPDEVTLHLVDAASQTRNRYGFRCPSCEVFVVKPAGTVAVELLLEGGVLVTEAEVAPWETELVGGELAVPAAPPHPEDPPTGPAFTPDDVLDLHALLQRDDWFDQLLDSVGK
jgi:hypothetical protein